MFPHRGLDPARVLVSGTDIYLILSRRSRFALGRFAQSIVRSGLQRIYHQQVRVTVVPPADIEKFTRFSGSEDSIPQLFGAQKKLEQFFAVAQSDVRFQFPEETLELLNHL